MGHSLLYNLKKNVYDIYYAFECNPYCFKALREIESQYPNLHFIDKAAWTHDKEMTLNIAGRRQEGSSLLQMKKPLRSRINVKCLNFNTWLSKNFTNEPINLDVDIEGAEYELLNNMIENESINLIQSISIEWHTNKLANVNYWELKAHIIEEIKKREIDFIEYHR